MLDLITLKVIIYNKLELDRTFSHFPALKSRLIKYKQH